MRGVGAILLIIVAAAAAAGCGGGSTATGLPPGTDGAPGATEAPAATEGGTGTGGGTVDVSTIAACELVTPDEVAGFAGGSLAAEPSGAITGPVCPYVVEAAGTTESYWLVISPGSEQAPFMEFLASDGEHDKVDGPWDEGYAGKDPVGPGDQVIVIAGDYAINAYGDGRRDVMIEMVKQAIARLP